MFKEKMIRQTIAGTLSWELREPLGRLCDTQERPQTVTSLLQGPDSVSLADAASVCSRCHHENSGIFLKASNCELEIIVSKWDHRTSLKARSR